MELRELEKKELIVSSAKNLILERGYSNISVEDITRNSGIAKGSFYTYFKSKHCVIDYILMEQIMKVEEKIAEFFSGEMSLKVCIEKLIKSRIILEDDDTIKRNLVMVSLFRNMDSLNEETLILLRRIEEINIELIKDILRRSEFKDEGLEIYSKLINDMVNSYKNFNLFISKKTKVFITNTDELREKYCDKEFKMTIDILIKSILKILTY